MSKADNQEKVLPPLPPRLVVGFEATNSAVFSISGVAEPNVEVELMKNDVSLGKEKTDDKGGFTFKNITLDNGGNTFTALASTEKEGNSELSKAITVVYDDQPPTLNMINPSEDKISVDSADFDVTGKSDKGVSVSINGKLAIVDDEGKFKLKVQLNAGKNSLEIIVRNQAGNEVKKTIEITYDI
jgi:phage-related protein